jgi:hypothetical protein
MKEVNKRRSLLHMKEVSKGGVCYPGLGGEGGMSQFKEESAAYEGSQ